MEYLIRRGRYGSCVHAGRLSRFTSKTKYTPPLFVLVTGVQNNGTK